MPDSKLPASRMAKWLSALFVLALVMGPGPGVYLVNPASRADVAWFGVPVLYVWAVFWFGVMAITVSIAYATLWRGDEDERGERR